MRPRDNEPTAVFLLPAFIIKEGNKKFFFQIKIAVFCYTKDTSSILIKNLSSSIRMYLILFYL